jgi:ribosome biogenesis GTPase / thiamine phosphate phosphatase
MNLSPLGWNDQFAAHFEPHAADGFAAARVALQHKHAYRLLAGAVELDGVCTGRLLHETTDRVELPVVGDWVVIRPRTGEAVADIHAVLPRQSTFIRRAAGPRAEAQVLAANLDTVFLVMALDGNYNVRRLERLLAITWDSGATPVVVLNKLDLCVDPDAARDEVAANAQGVDVIAISALNHTAIDALQPHLAPGRTIAVLGSSGVGKSTLVNRLLGEDRQRVGERRGDNSLGRHTTVHRELVPLPGGALIIDTPGLREVGLWDAGEGIDETFGDLTELATRCRFGDCTHDGEPGCAILAAIESGELDGERFAAWQKLAREQAFHDRKSNRASAAATKRLWKQRTVAMRQRCRVFGEE